MAELSRFAHYPEKVRQPETLRAYAILSSAHASASSFLDAFDGAGTELDSDTREDLLRAMLIFAGAGLDSMAKQLVRDAMAQVIQLQDGARENLRDFVERRLRRDDPQAVRLLAIALTSNQPRAELISELVDELTGGSLQSAEELSRLAAYFDVPTVELIPDFKLLSTIFAVRNQIAHELDADFSQDAGHRRPRERDEMVDYATELFRVAGKLLAAVEARV